MTRAARVFSAHTSGSVEYCCAVSLSLERSRADNPALSNVFSPQLHPRDPRPLLRLSVATSGSPYLQRRELKSDPTWLFRFRSSFVCQCSDAVGSRPICNASSPPSLSSMPTVRPPEVSNEWNWRGGRGGGRGRGRGRTKTAPKGSERSQMSLTCRVRFGSVSVLGVDGWIDGWHGRISDSPPQLPPPPLARWFLVSWHSHARTSCGCVSDCR